MPTSIGTVIDESVITPSSIGYLLVKLRILPPSATVEKNQPSVEPRDQATAKEVEQFLSTCEDAEDLDTSSTNGFAHAPYWPGVSSSDTFYENCSHFLSINSKTRKPSWGIALADDKANHLVFLISHTRGLMQTGTIACSNSNSNVLPILVFSLGRSTSSAILLRRSKDRYSSYFFFIFFYLVSRLVVLTHSFYA